jgi:hypothetical protein
MAELVASVQNRPVVAAVASPMICRLPLSPYRRRRPPAHLPRTILPRPRAAVSRDTLAPMPASTKAVVSSCCVLIDDCDC